MWLAKDCVGNLLCGGTYFETYADAWEYIRSVFPNETDWDQYDAFLI